MSNNFYAKGITAENLRAFLVLWAQLPPGIEEAMQIIIEGNDLFFDEDANSFSWCHLYELPIHQHIDFNFPGLLPEEQVLEWRKQVAESSGKIAALPNVAEQINNYFNARENPTKEDIKALRPFLSTICVYFYSIQYSLFCILYHGCFLNELIERIRIGDDQALFDAIRVDPTVIGCQSVIERISKARMLKDSDFLKELKKTESGVSAKLKQANYQKMRLILKVLSEAGATRLFNKELSQLFVEEINLYTANSAGGGVEKSLRKFADTYMKQNATT
ncbi:MAG: hypothetical protein U1D41_16790 [Nitrosomonas sp.]|uniref:hypothetical protein n=1 Tax=Nitrosomonas sp. TaxID=42353 RepID=UPI00274CF504|nr:hypothetical protein [Nitrosomonas sp.]MDP3608643.1 hypothetical protein [Methylophilus sp.]MDZ4107769.1 hypothetical protein [Nitrosomonas sp.]